MSQVAPALVACPRCQHAERTVLFESLNADLLAWQADLIAQGTFEQKTCARCGHVFCPEHHMLYVQHSADVWVVMYPRQDRPGFAAIERDVEQLMAREFAAAPPLAVAGRRRVRPRLVFGQHFLTEAVRTTRAGLDPALLECAKLIALRDQLGQLLRHGPCELCFECIGDEGQLIHGIYSLGSGERLDTLAVPGDTLAKVQAARAELEQRYPDLFRRPYISLNRYFFM